MFNNALGMISNNKHQLANEDVDEQHLVQQHNNFYGGGSSGGNASPQNMGVSQIISNILPSSPKICE
jgi:hypothetical protein